MQEVHCSFYKKINELDDGTYSIARYHAISEVQNWHFGNRIYSRF